MWSIKSIKKLARLNYLVIAKELAFFVRFFGLVILFLFFDLLRIISHFPLIRLIARPFSPGVKKVRDTVLPFFNSRSDGEISSLDLISLAVRHLAAKKVRTLITIGGMSIGFGSVIFLLSLGYGTQRLVISRVARLGEMKQINVTVGQSSALALNDKTLADFEAIENVDAVIPLVSVVSKVNYNNSISDAVGFGVTKQFLEESAIQPSRGRLFDDGDISSLPVNSESRSGQVAGAQNEPIMGVKMNKQHSQIRYSFYPLEWKPVYSQPSESAQIIGYTTRVVGEQDAVEVWGESYQTLDQLPLGLDTFGNEYSPWIMDTFPLWKKDACNPEVYGCIDGQYQVLKVGSVQQHTTGYVMETKTTIDRYKIVSETEPTIAEGEVIDQADFSIPAGKWIPVYSDPNTESEMLNLFTSSNQAGAVINGELIYGEAYADSNGWGRAGKNKNDLTLGYWVRAKLPLWRKIDCQDCDNLYLKEVDANEQQIYATALIRANQVKIEDLDSPPRVGSVLGIASESATLAESDEEILEDETASDSGDIVLANGSVLQATTQEDGSVDWVTIASGSGTLGTTQKTILPFPDSSKREVVVNTALLKVFSIPESEALDKTFTTTFILDEEFFDDGTQAESSPVELTIVGVIPDEKTPSFYLPFSDIKNLGIKNYTQVKIVVDNQNDLKVVRQQIEAMGFKTASVVDTVGKINNLFQTVRLLLSLLGMVALSVAALGMFNTLTVSLLEKTREVGLMKAIGMKSNEVKRLFLAESIVMGLSGGIFGLGLSIAVGQLLSFALSVFSLTKGFGYINLVYTPVALAFGIVTLSFIIGVLTGMYPSYRATKISALNALRYE